jgi:hypothetical protein
VGDDWYERRRDDPEGAFFRKVADQGPRKGEGGSTRQGIYCLTASGRLLAYKNAGQSPSVTREVLRQALQRWATLPETARRMESGAIEPAPVADPRFRREPPLRGVIVKVFTRLLEEQAPGGLCAAHCKTNGIPISVAHDHLWVTESELTALQPAKPVVGDSCSLPTNLAERILRFHLVDNTRGEPEFWRPQQILRKQLRLTVTEATDRRVQLRLHGTALLATASVAARRGYDAELWGYIEYFPGKAGLTRFDVVAVGEHWGDSTFSAGARPGRTPLGIAFTLATSDSPENRVPPQGARDLDEYFGR